MFTLFVKVHYVLRKQELTKERSCHWFYSLDVLAAKSSEILLSFHARNGCKIQTDCCAGKLKSIKEDIIVRLMSCVFKKESGDVKPELLDQFNRTERNTRQAHFKEDENSRRFVTLSQTIINVSLLFLINFKVNIPHYIRIECRSELFGKSGFVFIE